MTDEEVGRLAGRLLPANNRLLRQIALAELLGPPPSVTRHRELLARMRGEVKEAHPKGRID